MRANKETNMKYRDQAANYRRTLLSSLGGGVLTALTKLEI